MFSVLYPSLCQMNYSQRYATRQLAQVVLKIYLIEILLDNVSNWIKWLDLNWLILIHLLKSWDLTMKTSASPHDTPWPRTKSETTKAFQEDRKSSPFVDNFVCLCTFLKNVFIERGHVSNAEKSAEPQLKN